MASADDSSGLSLITKGRSDERPSSAPGGTTLESARITLSYADASAITRARNVVARVGGAEVSLTNNHLEALREIVSLMAPSPSRWQAGALSSAR